MKKVSSPNRLAGGGKLSRGMGISWGIGNCSLRRSASRSRARLPGGQEPGYGRLKTNATFFSSTAAVSDARVAGKISKWAKCDAAFRLAELGKTTLAGK